MHQIHYFLQRIYVFVYKHKGTENCDLEFY